MVFLDSNILVYAVDPRDARKHDLAAQIVDTAIDSACARISAQVLFEFSNICLKKLQMPSDAVLKLLDSLSYIETVDQTPALVIRSVEIKTLYGISLQDAMIIAAAEKARCNELLSEDLNDGQLYAGVRVRNPFA